MQICEGKPKPLPKQYSSQLRGLVRSMMIKDQRVRPSIKQLLQLPFLQPIRAKYVTMIPPQTPSTSAQYDRRRCGKCKSSIRETEFGSSQRAVKLNGIWYHRKCLACSECGVDFDPNSHVMLEDGSPVCGTCAGQSGEWMVDSLRSNSGNGRNQWTCSECNKANSGLDLACAWCRRERSWRDDEEEREKIATLLEGDEDDDGYTDRRERRSGGGVASREGKRPSGRKEMSDDDLEDRGIEAFRESLPVHEKAHLQRLTTHLEKTMMDEDWMSPAERLRANKLRKAEERQRELQAASRSTFEQARAVATAAKNANNASLMSTIVPNSTMRNNSAYGRAKHAQKPLYEPQHSNSSNIKNSQDNQLVVKGQHHGSSEGTHSQYHRYNGGSGGGSGSSGGSSNSRDRGSPDNPRPSPPPPLDLDGDEFLSPVERMRRKKQMQVRKRPLRTCPAIF